MKRCPQCASSRINRSHPKSLFENLLRIVLGYHFYRCKECNWRGRGRAENNAVASKVSLRKRVGLYVLAALIILFIVFVVIGTGDTAPPAQ